MAGRFPRHLRWAVGFVLLGLMAPGLKADAEEAPPPSLSFSEDVPRAVVEGVKSLSVFFKPRPPLYPGAVALARAVEHDLVTLHVVLNNQGYYDPLIRYELAENKSALTSIHIDPGPRYTLTGYRVEGKPEGTPFVPPRLDQPAEARVLVDAETTLLNRLADEGYPLARYVGRTYRVDHEFRTVEAELDVEAGQPLVFGEIRYTGQTRTRTTYLSRLVPWKPGTPYRASLVEAYRRTLLETELFNMVRITPASFSEDSRSLPLGIELTERRPRTVGGSISYDTDLGPGVEVFWQHRNLWGRGERLDLSGGYAVNNQHLAASLRVPQWPDRRTTLLGSVKLTNERSDAYNETGVVGELGFERRLSHLWKASVGGRLRYSDVNSDRVMSVSLPWMLQGDSTTSPLNPTEGWRATTTLTPVMALEGEQTAYMTWEQRLSGYLPLNRNKSTVLAGWGHIGGVIGADVAGIAPTSRFYAGGGGSVRGYSLRSIGPRDNAGDPLGGISLLEGGVEMRFPVRGAISGVVFAEGGSVSDTLVPDFSQPQFGAGAGVRYTTALAPLRLDVGVPLNPRKGDGRFQVYLSIGQAF